MAKKQTRRALSVSRETYDTAKQAAARDGVTASEWITRLVRAACPELGPQLHTHRAPRVVVHVPNATHEPPRRVPAPRHVLDRIAADRKLVLNGVRPGALCANCIEAPATHRGRVDLSGRLYPICDGCELPVDAKESA